MIDASDILAPSELENSDLLKADDADFMFDLTSKSLLFMTANNIENSPNHTHIRNNKELNPFKSTSTSSYNSTSNNNTMHSSSAGVYQTKLGINLTGNLINDTNHLLIVECLYLLDLCI